jgi:hypothetical protein
MEGWLVPLMLIAGPQAVATEPAGAFAAHLPAAVGDVSRWEIVTGSFDTPVARGSYLFYVNPRRAAMYQLMRYSVELRQTVSPAEERRGSAERVAFVRRPGVREPMACWERIGGAEPYWREVPAGSEAYNLEMSVLLRVLGAHSAARAADR